MIDVQQELEARLGEKVIFVTSYEPGKVHFLAITHDGIVCTESVEVKDLTHEFRDPLASAVDYLVKSIKEKRKYVQAKKDKAKAEDIINRYESKGI